MLIFFFRVLLLSSFLVAAIKLGDWKNWQRYYPTVLFVMVVNLAASFITYHHILWNYNPDIFVQTQTTIELINAFVLLPAVVFIYLSLFPFDSSKVYQAGYIAFWILLFSCIELFAHYIVGSLSYKNDWSWLDSFVFDIAMFSITRLHYSRPVWAWGISLIITAIIYTCFGLSGGEFK